MTDLRVEDTIKIWTPKGESEIQLLYGDITKLQLEDKVDLIMISAFPGDYAAVKRTVIGALWHNLGVRVEDLARKKELDARALFNCWLSSPLPTYSPYHKLLCFEKKRGEVSLSEQIRDLFRVFVPIFNNKETTVITPLLATGNQGFDKTLCLASMVEGAASWISAGLSLKCLKIVLYETSNADVNKKFKDLKKKWTKKGEELRKKNEEAWKTKFDVYIMYNGSDKQSVTKVKATLVKQKKDIKVYCDLPKFDVDKVWQGDIYQNMVNSNRIIAILTPSFVRSKDCLELFNMALCCGRLCKRDMLLPFYIEQVESMPVYMGLVQYFDCREKKEGDKREIKIDNACKMIVDLLDEANDGNSQATNTDMNEFKNMEEEKYDVFISYSHKNPVEANYILNLLSERYPDLKIFFDRNELTMGSLWQSSLYSAMASAECVIALISKAYIKSNVCQEEYNIALARHLSELENILFLPVCIEELGEVPYWLGKVKMADARGNFNSVAGEVVTFTQNWLQNGQLPDFVSQSKEEVLNIAEIYPKIREREVEEKYTVNKKNEIIEPKTQLGSIDAFKSGKDGSDIAISYAHDSLYCSVFLGQIIEKHIPSIDINYISDDTHGRMHNLDTARKIIILLSSDFVKSPQHMQELHIALCRQRASQGVQILHIVQSTELPEKPIFLNLFPCETSLKDDFWEKLCKKYIHKMSCLNRKTVISKREDFQGSFSCSYPDYLALGKAAFDVLKDFTKEEKPRTIDSTLNQLNIVKMKLEADEQNDLLDNHLTTDECVVTIEIPVTESATEKCPNQNQNDGQHGETSGEEYRKQTSDIDQTFSDENSSSQHNGQVDDGKDEEMTKQQNSGRRVTFHFSSSNSDSISESVVNVKRSQKKSSTCVLL